MSSAHDKSTRPYLLDSLRTRLFLAILATVIPIAAMLGYYVWHQYRSLAADGERNAVNVVSITAAYDNALLNDTRGILVTLSSSPVLRQGLWDECREYFSNLLARLPRYMNLGVIDEEGRLVCSGRPDVHPKGSYLGDQDFYRQAFTQPDVVLSGFMLERSRQDAPTMAMALRVPGNSGTTQAVVYVSLNLTSLATGAAIPHLPNGAQLSILDRQGHVLQHVPDHRYQLGERVDPYPSGSSGHLLHRRFLDGQGTAWQQFDLRSGPRGDPSGVSIRYQIADAVLYADARRALWSGVLAIALLLSIAVLAAWGLMQIVAGSSLIHLRNAVRRLAAQDFSGSVADRLQGRELREIGKQFDDMATALQTYQRTLKQSEQSYRLLFANSPSPMLVMSIDSGRFVVVNDQAVLLYGYGREEFPTLGLDDLRVEILNRQPRSPFSYEKHKRRDGQVLLVEVRNLSLMFEGQLSYLLVIRDLTEHEALSRGLRDRDRLLGQLMEVTAEAIFAMDLNGDCIFANQSCAESLGYADTSDLVGRHFHSLAHYGHEDGRPYPHEACRMLQALRQSVSVHVDDEVLWRRDGTSFPVEYWATPVHQDGELEMCLVTFIDISERRQQQQALMYQATHDPLTRLLNRGAMLQALHHRIETAPDTPWILVMSNLDGFKEVNEALGHDIGDHLLQEVAQRCRQQLPADCLLGRVGGDEFGLVLMDIDIRTVQRRLLALLAAIREPFMFNGLPVRISSSFGMAQYPQHGRDPDELVRCADMAMRRAKRDGLGVTAFNPEDGAHTRDRLLLRGELRAALDDDQFLLHLQPKVRLQDYPAADSVIGFEALARWRHPKRGLIPPASFIPITEVSDLIHPFTSWVMNQAIADCAHLQAQAPGVGVAVNVSTRNLMDAQLVGQIRESLERHALPATLLELEVTESALMADPARALVTLQELHAMGVRLSVDDFGTGYSSFSYLKKLPVDALKIDQSFVSGMAGDPDLQSIVRSIIEMAHTLGLSVIAEGVETDVVLNLLRDMGCDFGQGYLISSPIPLAQAAQWLRDRQISNGSQRPLS